MSQAQVFIKSKGFQVDRCVLWLGWGHSPSPVAACARKESCTWHAHICKNRSRPSRWGRTGYLQHKEKCCWKQIKGKEHAAAPFNPLLRCVSAKRQHMGRYFLTAGVHTPTLNHSMAPTSHRAPSLQTRSFQSARWQRVCITCEKASGGSGGKLHVWWTLDSRMNNVYDALLSSF